MVRTVTYDKSKPQESIGICSYYTLLTFRRKKAIDSYREEKPRTTTAELENMNEGLKVATGGH